MVNDKGAPAMTLDEFDRLLAEVSLRLRLERAAGAAFRPVAGLLIAASIAVLSIKLSAPRHSGALVDAALLLTAALVWGALLLAWLRRPVSALVAAAEIDRVGRLKERASSLVAARSGAVPRTAAWAELERDAVAALADLDRGTVLHGLLPRLSARAKWLVGLSAVFLGTMLVPARAGPAAVDLASLLAGGPEIVTALEGGGDPTSPPTAAKAAGKVLTIVKGPPPADPAGAERQRQALEALAADLKKTGSAADAALARKIEELARELGRLAGPGLPDGRAEPGGAGQAEAERAAAIRSYPEYAELLARYFGPESG